MKTTLTVDIDYNPKKTDPDGLARAMDRLVETMLSTPGIMQEYGNPRVGEFFVAGATGHSYSLRIDGPLLRNQRRLLLRLSDSIRSDVPYVSNAADEKGLFEGVVSLLDEIADQAHDRHGIDCLLEDPAQVDDGPSDNVGCECGQPGYFFSGVPGILAHMEDGKLAPDAKVERCNLCQRYSSDAAALERLRELGLVQP